MRAAICAIVRDEASYIEEWVDFHRYQGVAHFRIYDNGSIDGTPDILRQLGIEPIIWAGRPHNFDEQQRAAYLEGARMLAGRCILDDTCPAYRSILKRVRDSENAALGSPFKISLDIWGDRLWHIPECFCGAF
jgi:hypothetical protein